VTVGPGSAARAKRLCEGATITLHHHEHTNTRRQEHKNTRTQEHKNTRTPRTVRHTLHAAATTAALHSVPRTASRAQGLAPGQLCPAQSLTVHSTESACAVVQSSCGSLPPSTLCISFTLSRVDANTTMHTNRTYTTAALPAALPCCIERHSHGGDAPQQRAGIARRSRTRR
jgi:hypothetical protein